MRHTVAPLALALLALTGCELFGEPTRPPPPPPPAHIPPEAMAEVYPANALGEPVVVESLVQGDRMQIIYDDTQLDPVRFWGECLGRVAGCYHQNPTSIDGCVALIETCESDDGGTGCCPTACVESYQSARSEGLDQDAAADASFTYGACVSGFHDQLAAAGIEPPLMEGVSP